VAHAKTLDGERQGSCDIRRQRVKVVADAKCSDEMRDRGDYDGLLIFWRCEMDAPGEQASRRAGEQSSELTSVHRARESLCAAPARCCWRASICCMSAGAACWIYFLSWFWNGGAVRCDALG
jgi:hypothetical protein